MATTTNDPGTIISNAYSQSNTTITSAQSYAERLAQLAEVKITLDDIPSLDLGALDEMMSTLDNILNNQPSMAKLTDSSTYDKPAAPGSIDVGDMGQIDVPDFTDAVPTPSFPPPVSITQPDAPTNKYNPGSYTIPAKPNYNMPTAPQIKELIYPDVPLFEYPDYLDKEPVNDIGEPLNLFKYDEAAFDSALQSPVVAALLKDIAGGLVPDEELDYGLAVSRIDNEVRKSVADTKRQFTSSGFSMPTGAMMAAVAATLQNAANQKITEASGHALKISGLKIENRKTAMGNAIQYETVLRQFFGAVWERALKAAQYLNEAGMEIFKGRIDRYNAKVNAYAIGAQVYAERMKALTIKAEVYATQLKGVEIQSEVQKTSVVLYNAQMAGIETQMKIFQSELEAVKTALEIDYKALQAYSVEVEAFKGLNQANEVQIKAYEAQVSAENLKLEPYKLSLSTQAAKTETAKVKAQISAENLKASTESAKLKVQKYATDIQKYHAEVEHNMLFMQRQVEKYQGDISSFNAKGYITERAYNMLYEVRKANKGYDIEKARFGLQKSELEMRQQVNQFDLKMRANIAIADVYKNLAAGYLSAINAIAMVSTSTTKKG